MPVATLNRVAADDFSWNVPGLREELVTSLIRRLPKNLRVNFVPAPNKAREFLAAVPPGEEPLLDALERWLRSTTGVVVPREAWDWAKVPEHLRPTYRVVDDSGAEQARGKDLEALKEPLRPQFAAAMAEVADDSGLARTGETRVGVRHHRGVVHPDPRRPRGDAGSRRWSTRARRSGCGCSAPTDEREARHRLGVRRLLLLALALPSDPRCRRALDNAEKLALAGSPYPSVAELLEDCRAAVVGGRRRRGPTGARPRRRTTRWWPCARLRRGRAAGAGRRRDAGPRRLAGRRQGCSAAAPRWRCCPRSPT